MEAEPKPKAFSKLYTDFFQMATIIICIYVVLHLLFLQHINKCRLCRQGEEEDEAEIFDDQISLPSHAAADDAALTDEEREKLQQLK